MFKRINNIMIAIQHDIEFLDAVEISLVHFWEVVLPWCMWQVKFFPSKCTDLLTTSDKLAQFINQEIIEEAFYQKEEDFEYLVDETIGRYWVRTKYGTQSEDVSELTDIVEDFFDVDYTDDVITLSKKI